MNRSVRFRENRDPTLTHWTVGFGSNELNAPMSHSLSHITVSM